MNRQTVLFVVPWVLLIGVIIFGLSERSAGEPKNEGRASEQKSEDRLSQLEKKLDALSKKLEQMEKSPTVGRWQLKTITLETLVGTPPQKVASGSQVFLFDTQTGKLLASYHGAKVVELYAGQ